jgi:glyoxylase-like metal-dependent hydrolase (beta-lactamase superfamily II)
MRVEQIAPGLWRWTGLHPDWTAEQGGAGGWGQEVGSTYAETAGAIVLVDPLIPPEDRERFLAALDRDVERAAEPVDVLLTTESHTRSAHELAGRYGGSVRAAGEAPDGVDVVETGWYGELVYWLPAFGALVAGDVMVGGPDGLRLTDSWLGDDRENVRRGLLPLLELPVERVLVAHGEPVLADGREALARALEG